MVLSKMHFISYKENKRLLRFYINFLCQKYEFVATSYAIA